MSVEEILKEKGYIKFNPNPTFDRYIDERFQKRFDDEIGKKYFITVNKYDEFSHPCTGETFPAAYEFEIQLTDKETDCPVRILSFGGWDVDKVEERAEAVWNMGCWKYYEKWEDN